MLIWKQFDFLSSTEDKRKNGKKVDSVAMLQPDKSILHMTSPFQVLWETKKLKRDSILTAFIKKQYVFCQRCQTCCSSRSELGDLFKFCMTEFFIFG